MAALVSVVGLPKMLQFNYESTVSYGDDGFATLSVKGMLEIPLTRSPNQKARTFTQTADQLRGEVERRVMSGIDLMKFRMTRRDFNLSKDKRVLTWNFTAEEIPFMSLPIDCTVARGSFNVRPNKAGAGLITWLCTLRCTYTVRADRPRRLAWLAFLAMLRVRMARSRFGNLDVGKATERPPKEIKLVDVAIGAVGGITLAAINLYNAHINKKKRDIENSRRAWLIDFSFDEGLYLDSKTITFSASWRLNTTFSHILLASGIWEKSDSARLWAINISNISGAQSWVGAPMTPDVIVDFNGGQ